MKNKKSMKVLLLVLCLTLAFSLFAGCSQEGPKDSDKPVDSKPTTGPVTTDTPATEELYFNETGYPIVDEPITLNFMVSKSPAHGDFNDMEYWKAMEDLTNIKIEFTQIDSGSWEEKKNLALAGGDLPDVFFTGISIADENMYGVQGDTFVPLQDLIDKYAPNIKQTFAEYPDSKFAVTAMDGNIYMLPYVADTPTVAGSTLYVRGDWIDKTVVDRPETLDDFYEMLVAFKGLGEDKIPIVPNNFEVLKQFLINAFGDHIETTYGRDADDKVVYVPSTDQYKRMVEFLNKLYTEGLLDNEVFTQTGEAANAKVTEGIAGCMTFGTLLLPSHYESGVNETELLKPLVSEWNDTPKILGRYAASIGNAVITKVNKYPEATMRWFDINYSEEDVAPGLNCISLWLGIRDVHWEFKSEDKSTYGRLMPADSQISEIEWSNKYITPGWGPCKLVMHAIPEKNPGQEMKAKQSLKNWFPYAQYPFPDQYLRYTDEEQSRLNTVANDVETLTTQREAQFITGEVSLDQWDSYINNLKSAGLDELLQLKQAAYERYKAADKN